MEKKPLIFYLFVIIMTVIPLIQVSVQGYNIQDLQLWDGCCSYIADEQRNFYTMFLANTILEMK
jgi:hypothetical protein